MELIASAPGKLFILGEYAVTAGGPSILCATERRLACRLVAEPGRSALTIVRRGRAFEVAPDVEDPGALDPEIRFAATAFLVACRHFELAPAAFTLHPEETLDGDGAKWGLGGSAAVTAAVVALVGACAGQDTADTAAVRAGLGRAAHRLAQGSGSGADVIAASLGGLLRVPAAGAPEIPGSIGDASRASAVESASRLELPAGWRLTAHHSGRAARSGPRVECYHRALAGRGPLGPAAAALLTEWNEAMGEAADAFAAGLEAGEGGAAARAVARGSLLFGLLPRLAGVPVFSPGLRRLAQLAGAAGVASKPSGAGGGDCAVQMLADWHPGNWNAKAVQAGFAEVALAPEAPGAEVA